MLKVYTRPALNYFHWSDVSAALEKEMGCKWEDFHHTFLEWMSSKDPEAGSESYGTTHNIDEQIAELQKIIDADIAEGRIDLSDVPEDEMEEAINDEYYGMPFLKAMKKVLGEHSTAATFYYSW
ncbi:hypothetical protein D3C75_501640 [compost metagenome]